MVVSTVYATLGVDAVKEAVNEGKASMVLCNRVSVPLIGKIADQMPTLKVTRHICSSPTFHFHRPRSSFRLITENEPQQSGFLCELMRSSCPQTLIYTDDYVLPSDRATRPQPISGIKARHSYPTVVI